MVPRSEVAKQSGKGSRVGKVLYARQLRHTPGMAGVQVVKKPGQDNTPIMSEMDLTYKERYTDTYIPEAYERLILDAIRGDQQHFVRR